MSTTNGNLSGPNAASTVEAAMARVRATVPSAKGATVPPGSGRQRAGEAYLFPEDLYRNLHQARTIAGHLGVDYKLGWRTPLIGPAWMVVRRRIHQEIRIYIDALTTHQNNLNTYLIRSLGQVVDGIDSLGLKLLKRQQAEQAEVIAALQAELGALRRRVEALEAGRTAGEEN